MGKKVKKEKVSEVVQDVVDHNPGISSEGIFNECSAKGFSRRSAAGGIGKLRSMDTIQKKSKLDFGYSYVS